MAISVDVAARVDAVAHQQADVVGRGQALRAGLSPSQVGHLVRSGRWRRIHPGVFLTTSAAPSSAARQWAALLHAGPDAVLSHASAGHEQALVDEPPAVVHVLVAANHRVTARPGVVLHRSRHLDARRHPARTPPQTRVEDTVLDLVEGCRDVDQVVHVLARACQRRLTTPARLLLALGRRRRLRHRSVVMEVLDDVRDGVASPLERRYARDVERAHGLPRGHRNAATVARGGRRYRDVHYEEHATGVELDGRTFHPDDQRASDDRRDNDEVVHGLAVLRYGWSDVVTRPCEVAAEVAHVLRARGWDGELRPGSLGCSSSVWQLRSAG